MFGNTTAEVHQAAAQWQKLMVDTWSQWTAKTVSSESFAAASGAYMDWTLSTQKMLTEMSGQMMETMDVPRRSDLARLASQIQSVETRLLDQEDSQEEIRDLLLSLHAKLDRLQSVAPSGSPAPDSTEAGGVTPESAADESASSGRRTSRRGRK